MNIQSISFQNYRGFASREEVVLAPLTILLGRNSSGKSSIARLPLLIARSLSDRATAPVDLSSDGIDFGASFVDLVHNRFEHGSISLGIKLISREQVYSLEATIQHFSEFMLQVVTTFALKVGDVPLVSLAWNHSDPLASSLAYAVTVRDQTLPSSYPVRFAGLVPQLQLQIADDAVAGVLAEATGVLDLIQRSTRNIGYLGPFRVAPRRNYPFPGGMPEHVGLSGIEAPALLAADHLRRGGRIVDSVSEWYQQNLGGWGVSVSKHGDAFSLVLATRSAPEVEVNLADAGTGLSQVLPLVVQRLFEAKTNKRAPVEIVEQPELHLHPAAHANLADLYLNGLSENSRFIVETHSELFVLRVRRRIAEKLVDPKKVKLYWIDDTTANRQVREILLDSDGNVSEWPVGVFSEDLAEVRAIGRASHP